MHKLNDLHVNVPVVEVEKLMSRGTIKPESSGEVRDRVIKAREIQNKHIKKFCELDKESNLLLK